MPQQPPSPLWAHAAATRKSGEPDLVPAARLPAEINERDQLAGEARNTENSLRIDTARYRR